MATEQTRNKKAERSAETRKATSKARTEGSAERERPREAAKRSKTARDAGDSEQPEVLGGRLLIAAGIIAVMLLLTHIVTIGNMLEPEQPAQTNVGAWQVGGTSEVTVTIVTADYNLLTCSSEQSFEGKHCAYKTESDLWPREKSAPVDDNKANIIQPFRTWVDNRLIFVAGLWADPALATRLHREPSEGVQSDKLARFTAQCKVRFVGRLEQPKVKWLAGQNWINEESAFVAVPESCKIVGDQTKDCPSGPVCALINLFN